MSATASPCSESQAGIRLIETFANKPGSSADLLAIYYASSIPLNSPENGRISENDNDVVHGNACSLHVMLKVPAGYGGGMSGTATFAQKALKC
jgi:hypothetical protein